ncbi:MAG TPA: serine/threonine-protein kinase [Polyangia bacterium]|jgi:serine/threonine-protein kinase|nr:serine/threonine-protein kinase [Polyangia bacterium]
MAPDDSQLEDIVGADLVYTKAAAADAAPHAPETDGAGAGGAPARGHENRVLALVDGRRTVADILLLSPLDHASTLQHLRSLYERGLLLRSGGGDRPPARARTATGANVIVIDTRHRDRGAATREAVAPRPIATPPPGAVPAAASGAGASGLYKLGRYEVATRIGQGGMGSIYVCRLLGDPQPERLYTLKVVRQYSDQQDVAAASLAREGRIAGRLNHPNVQRVVETGTFKKQPYLILDYIAGVSLTDMLLGERRPPPAIIVSVLIDALRGLEAAHSLTDERGAPLGLVHGDVSPPNILVGTDGLARITDFGSSWIAAEEPASRGNVAALGKPSYMAPEQLMAEPLDARTDLFAMGATMYAALTGQELFLADTYEAVVLNVMRKRVPPPSELGAPPALDDICLHALSRAKEGRFQNAAAMARALFEAASAQDLVASPREVAEWVTREFGESLDEQRRLIQRAFELGGSSQGSGTFMLAPAPAPNEVLAPTPVHGVPAVDLPAPRPADERGRPDDAVRAGSTSEKKLARTLFLPSTGDPTKVERASSPSQELKTLRQWLVEERRVIMVAVVCGIAMLALTIALVRPSSSRRPAPAPALPATAASH